MTESIVIDASAAIRAAISDQTGHEDAAEAWELATSKGWDVLAPDLFLYEIGQVVARSRIPVARRAQTQLLLYESVHIERPSLDALARALDVANDGKLSFYDASYLALAEQVDGILWTEDRELLKRFPGRTADTNELMRRLGARR